MGSPVELTSIFIGFVVGAVATGIAWNLSMRTGRKPETAKVTALWSLKDVTADGARPAVIAERLEGVKLPMGTKVIVPSGSLSTIDPDILMSCEVRMHPDVRLNAVFGKDRALVFSGPVAPRQFAVVTTEDATVRRLQMDFQRMWGEASAHVEPVAISDLAHKEGRVVDVAGRVLEIMEYRGRKMMRLTDGKVSVGVVAQKTDVAAYQGGNVRVVGRMHREGGMPYIEADKVETLESAVAH